MPGFKTSGEHGSSEFNTDHDVDFTVIRVMTSHSESTSRATDSPPTRSPTGTQFSPQLYVNMILFGLTRINIIFVMTFLLPMKMTSYNTNDQ